MIPRTPVRTGRLELVPATAAILIADSGDRQELGRLLDAAIPAGWPPPLLDDAALAAFVAMETEGSDPFFRSWYWILSGPSRILIGSGGSGSCPGDPLAAMIGYSVLEPFQGQGFATEAIRALVPAIFCHPGILKIRAATYPGLGSSIRVLEKCGFTPAGPGTGGSGMEEGTLVFECARPACPAR